MTSLGWESRGLTVLSKEAKSLLQNELRRIKVLEDGAAVRSSLHVEGPEDEFRLIVATFNDVVKLHIESLSTVLAVLGPSGTGPKPGLRGRDMTPDGPF